MKGSTVDTGLWLMLVLGLGLVSSMSDLPGGHHQGHNVDPCHGIKCGDHGSCHVDHHGDATCRCDAGYSGFHCQVHDQCYDIICGDHGSCHVDHHGDATCRCDAGYSGFHCQAADLCNNNSCSGQGICQVIHVEHASHTPTVSCTCNVGFFGDNCQFQEVSAAECMQNGNACRFGHCLFDKSSEEYSCQCGKDEVHVGLNCIPITDSSSTTIVPTTSTAQTTPSTTQTTPSTTQPTSSTTQATPLTTQETHSTTQNTPSTTPVPLTTTQTSPTQSSTTPTPIIATVPAIKYSCQKFNTVMDIGSHKPSENTNVTSCPFGSSATPEAFVLDHCNVTSPGNWTQGTHVMSQCQNIPLYTPVATFFNQRYSSIGGLSGILLGCLPSGFKLGVQECDKSPDILHLVSGGFLTMDPNFYYTVQ